MTKRLMMIGYGAMGREVHRLLPTGMNLEWVVVPSGSCDRLADNITGQTQVLKRVADCDGRPDLVVECAGHLGLLEHGIPVLTNGWTLAVVSTGALSDSQLYENLRQAAEQGGGKLQILAGAVAGMDGLAAAHEGGLDEVTYEACKPPESWKGSSAEQMIDLDSVTEVTLFFEGNAGEAARQFPANANVAATIALNGLGMENTRVRLLVDPGACKNTHRICVKGRFGQFKIELNGNPLENNPKTSMLAALSVVRACRQVLEPVVL